MPDDVVVFSWTKRNRKRSIQFVGVAFTGFSSAIISSIVLIDVWLQSDQLVL